MTPEVTVIVPLWNSAATIEATLESLCQQTLSDWEAIVVNDGSTDDGPARALQFADRDARVKVVGQANGGLSAARNAGLALARGYFVQFLDADDTLPVDSLATLCVKARESGGAAFGAFAWVESKMDSARFTVDTSCRSAGLNELLECNRFPVHAQVIARLQIGEVRFDESLRSAEDWDLWLRLAARGVRWESVDSVVANYHLTPGSMSRDDARMLDSMGLVARSAFAAARTQGRGDCDASRERERRVRLRLALECATRSVLNDESPGADRGAALLGSIGPTRGELDPQSLARAAYWTLPQAARRTPAAWSECDPCWLAVIDRLWARCERERWAPPGAVNAGRAALSELLVDGDAVVHELVERARSARSVELIGLGRNGRRIARALVEARIPFAVRDDEVAPGWVECNGVQIPARPVEGAYAPGAVAIVSVERDSGLIQRLPRGVSPLRWATVRRELSSGVQERLSAVCPSDAPRERAA